MSAQSDTQEVSVLNRRTAIAVALLLLAATSSYAITYIVPSDRDLVRSSPGIVIATGVSSHSHYANDGRLVTTAELKIERVLKGSFVAGDTLQLTEIGGQVGDLGLLVPGSPRYDAGSRYLIFVTTNHFGEQATFSMGVGRFSFTDDGTGRRLLTRGSGGEDIFGFDPNGTPHQERLRDSDKFLQFIASEVKGEPSTVDYFVEAAKRSVTTQATHLHPVANFTRGSYLTTGNPRWQSPPSIAWQTFGSISGFSNGGRDGVATGCSMWTGAGAGVNYSLGGTLPASPTPSGLDGPQNDGINSVLFNDPHGIVAGQGPNVAALGGTWTSGTFPLGGETFANVLEGDVEVRNSLSLPESLFAAVLTHELGHTLGFRHSNQLADSSTPCSGASFDCSGTAIMNSSVSVTSLQTWDVSCISTVYGSGPPPCNPATTVTASANPTSIAAGNTTTLSVVASGGSSPYSYQWYIGNPGVTNNQVGAATQQTSISDAPTSTTTYWVQATPTCGGTGANSNAVTVTVTCTSPGITVQPQSQSITAGSGVTLSVVATGSNPTYQWFIGNPGITNNPVPGGTGPSIFVSPSSNTTYWVKVSACSTSVNSGAADIIVAPCTSASITSQPQSTSILSGQTATLQVGAAGTNLTYQWYIGNPSNTSNPIFNATQNFLQVTLTTATTYWVRVSGCNNSFADSAAATVSIGQACSANVSSITASSSSVFPGDSFNLTANATVTGGTLSYQWFTGALNNTSGGVIGTTQTITVSETATTNYWVKATASCSPNPSATAQLSVPLNTGACGSNANQLCVNNARYKVTLSAKDPNGKIGQGTALYQSNVFGYFTLPDFSNPGDPQIFVKVVGPLQGQHGLVPWVFYSGLTNLDYTITVVDTTTSQTFNTYHKAPPPAGSVQSFGDYDVDGSVAPPCSNVTISSGQTSAGSCANSSSALCLLDRFRVTLHAKVNPANGNQETDGTALPVNSQFGFFTTPPITQASDVQAFVKMIDATGPFGTFWVFLGGLTDFNLTVTVTDTRNGKQKIYNKPAGSTCGLNDTSAFTP